MSKTCKERVDKNYQSRMHEIRTLYALWLKDSEYYDYERGNLDSYYGLSFDYVSPGTYNDQSEGYFRYLLSWDGPSDEFRIYAYQIDSYKWSIYRIEYWFLDWFDGSHIELSGYDKEFTIELMTALFIDIGSFDHEYEKELNY